MDDNTSQGLTGKILFVDDETNILKSLQRELMDTDYEIHIAPSAAEGLKVLETEKIDIVVSDYKMPGMDGVEFLKVVMKRFPSACRVILSGFVDQHSVLKALSSGLVSTYIPKPWDTEALLQKLNHLILTRQALKNIEILKTVNSIEELPTLPNMYKEFVEAVQEESPYGKLASIITRDIASTTKLLRIASSAYYHLDKDVSVERALSYIGINAVRQVLLFASLADGGRWDWERRSRLQDISVHSALVNCGMGALYHMKYGESLPEHFTSICITHDIGKVIMLEHLSDRYDSIVAYMKENPESDFYQSELTLGFEGATHAEIGAYFLDLWGLPQASVEASLYHHDLKGYVGDVRILETCRAADLLADYIALSSNGSGGEIPSFPAGYGEKDRVCDLITRLREKRERLN